MIRFVEINYSFFRLLKTFLVIEYFPIRPIEKELVHENIQKHKLMTSSKKF